MKIPNLFGVVAVVSLLTASLASANLITNGDFQTGDFTGWTVTNAATGSNLAVTLTPPSPDGTLGAAFSATGPGFDVISQTFATTPGALYNFSFFYQPVSRTPPSNEFIAFFNGVNLYDNPDTNSGFTTLTFSNLMATSNFTTIEFRAFSATGTDFLDDVSVTRVPDNGSSVLLLGLGLFSLCIVRRGQFSLLPVALESEK